MSVIDNKHGWLNFIYQKLFRNTTQSDTINEVLFYGINDVEKSKQMGLNNLFCIYYVITHASKSIDVCVPSLASSTIAKCLIDVKKKSKVKIRVIVHNSGDYHNLPPFAENGIEVKVTVKLAERLQHEFILIDACDKDGVAVLGSIDYETTRVNCNRDATILTSDGTLLRALDKEFDRIWQQLELMQIDRN